MRHALITVVLLAAVAAVAGILYLKMTGLSARPAPGVLETYVARSLRHLAVSSDLRGRANPVPATDAAVAAGRSHFAKQCAICHANNGSGDIMIGRGLFPKAPDMRAAATQTLSDGELFYIIEYGVRFTGMPAWGDGSAKGEELAWQLVHFIRRLPHLSSEEVAEMEGLNPQTP